MDFKINEKHCLTKEATQKLNKYFKDLYSNISKEHHVIICEFNTAMFDNGVFDDVNEDNAEGKINQYCHRLGRHDNIVSVSCSNVMGDNNKYIYLTYNGLCYQFESVYFKWESFYDNNGNVYALYGFFYDDTPLCCFFIEGDNYVPYCKETVNEAKKFLFSEEC